MKNLSQYNKFWVALLTAVGVLATACAPTDAQAAFVVTSPEWFQVLVAFLGALGVYQVSNK